MLWPGIGATLQVYSLKESRARLRVAQFLVVEVVEQPVDVAWHDIRDAVPGRPIFRLIQPLLTRKLGFHGLLSDCVSPLEPFQVVVVVVLSSLDQNVAFDCLHGSSSGGFGEATVEGHPWLGLPILDIVCCNLTPALLTRLGRLERPGVKGNSAADVEALVREQRLQLFQVGRAEKRLNPHEARLVFKCWEKDVELVVDRRTWREGDESLAEDAMAATCC